MTHRVKIGIDIMGSDHSPAALLEALRLVPAHPDVLLIPIGTPEFKPYSPTPDYIEAPEFIAMQDNPLTALRRKKNASILVGMRRLKENKLDALVSAGNTGALLLSAKTTLKTYPKLSRPALVALLPTKKKAVAILDLGASVRVKASDLVQFAHLGAAYQRARHTPHPRVGILNIGAEPTKGTPEMRDAFHILSTESHPHFHFAGNIEGRYVFDGDVDVLVTDGFTGNILLKTAEGFANLVLSRLSALPPATLASLHLTDLHSSSYSGALLAGIPHLVLKCHGDAPPESFAATVLHALHLAKSGFEATLKAEFLK